MKTVYDFFECVVVFLFTVTRLVTSWTLQPLLFVMPGPGLTSSTPKATQSKDKSPELLIVVSW